MSCRSTWRSTRVGTTRVRLCGRGASLAAEATSGGDQRGLDHDRQFDIGSVIRYYFKPALKALGLVGVRWHDLRHYYAPVMISMIARALSTRSTRSAGGWAQTTVDVYGHLLDARPNGDILDDIMASAEAKSANVAPLRRTS